MTGWAAGWVDKWICGQAGVDPRPAVGVKVYEITAREEPALLAPPLENERCWVSRAGYHVTPTRSGVLGTCGAGGGCGARESGGCQGGVTWYGAAIIASASRRSTSFFTNPVARSDLLGRS